MGMFDYVRARCPDCGEVIEEQSKAGPCQLKDYTLDNAPASVLEDMAQEEWWCNHCESRWALGLQIITKAWLEKPQEDY